jgi:hypothetical protein
VHSVIYVTQIVQHKLNLVRALYRSRESLKGQLLVVKGLPEADALNYSIELAVFLDLHSDGVVVHHILSGGL